VLTAAAVGAALALGLVGCSAERGASSSASETAAATSAADAASGSAVATGSAGAAGCTSTGGELIGVTMPTSSSQRWIQDGDNVKKQLEAAGYKVDLQYAENDIPTQVNQVDNQISNGAKVLIIASIDGTAPTSQLQNAADNDIKDWDADPAAWVREQRHSDARRAG
jgi:putative multiple sugar transport system substrate-binding protein